MNGWLKTLQFHSAEMHYKTPGSNCTTPSPHLSFGSWATSETGWALVAASIAYTCALAIGHSLEISAYQHWLPKKTGLEKNNLHGAGKSLYYSLLFQNYPWWSSRRQVAAWLVCPSKCRTWILKSPLNLNVIFP